MAVLPLYGEIIKRYIFLIVKCGIALIFGSVFSRNLISLLPDIGLLKVGVKFNNLWLDLRPSPIQSNKFWLLTKCSNFSKASGSWCSTLGSRCMRKEFFFLWPFLFFLCNCFEQSFSGEYSLYVPCHGLHTLWTIWIMNRIMTVHIVKIIWNWKMEKIKFLNDC